MFADDSFIDYIRPFVVKHLKTLGVKFTGKKMDYKHQPEMTNLINPFNAPLESLEKDCVTLSCDVETVVPVFLLDSVERIGRELNVEGLFRKSGSSSQKKSLMSLLEKGQRLSKSGSEFSVITVAEMLKFWLRQLPEPLIPYKLHDIFLKSLTSKKDHEEAVLLCCLLLPYANLSTLAYLTQFLLRVSKNSKMNRMGVKNLAIIFAPNMMPVKRPSKLTSDGTEELSKHVQIVEILIAKAESVGTIPSDISDVMDPMGSLGSMSESDSESQVQGGQKKRSSSLTRIFNVLRRIVRRPPTPDDDKKTTFRHFLTPKAVRTSSSDEATTGAFAKRAEKCLTPCIRYPSSTSLTPRNIIARNDTPKPERRPRRSVSFRETTSVRSGAATSEFVQIPKIEYEAIKERMAALESRLNDEAGKVHERTLRDAGKAHERTVREADVALMSAKAADLRIKRILSERETRSPSARKIGRMRRRSNIALPTMENRMDEEQGPSTRILDATSISGFEENIDWESASNFFSTQQRQVAESTCPRESVQILRTKKAGNVQEKKRMFEDQTPSNDRSSHKFLMEEHAKITPTHEPVISSRVTRPCTRLKRGTALAPLKGTNYVRRNFKVSGASTSRRSPRMMQ